MSDWLTYAEAGIELGGQQKPWSKKTIQRLIQRRWLTSNGLHSKLARVERESVDALSNALKQEPPPCLGKPKNPSRRRSGP